MKSFSSLFLKSWGALLPLCGPTLSLWSAPASISVDLTQPGHAVSPTLYGIFFEDINCSAYGGHYAEMIRNRSFEDSDRPDHWRTETSEPAIVKMAVDSSAPASSKNLHSLKVQIANLSVAQPVVFNEGYWGISLTNGQLYELSFLARGGENFNGPLVSSLEGSNGAVYAEAKASSLTTDWKLYRFSLSAKGTDPKARLVISTTTDRLKLE